jgi:hypothetical protein
VQRCERRALPMWRDDASEQLDDLRLAGVMLLVVLPIIPIQPLFGVVGSGLSAIALLVVGLGGRGSAGRPSSEERAASVTA